MARASGETNTDTLCVSVSSTLDLAQWNVLSSVN